MKTSHGVIQGYDGVAMVDDRHQAIVHAEAFGEAQEQELLEPMMEGTRENLKAIGKQEHVFARAKLTADSGFKHFTLSADQRSCICPAGRRLYRKGWHSHRSKSPGKMKLQKAMNESQNWLFLQPR